MSDASYPISATMKGRSDSKWDAPWVVVYGHSPQEVQAKLQGVVDSGLLSTLAEADNALKATTNAAPLVAQGQQAYAQPPAQPQQSPWGASPQGQQQPQQQNRNGGPPHPEGKACHCGNVLERKTTQNGKAKWQCPDWRWNNGNPNGHAMEWAN